jgi:pSer/pThr/pTyr-binding forkhead associated (FHA) protein
VNKLLYRDPGGTDGELVLGDKATIVVGRDPGCDVVSDDAGVSPRHAQLTLVGGWWWIISVGDSETRVNDARVTAKVELRNNDVIQCGTLFLRYVDDRPPVVRESVVPPVIAKPKS